LGIASVFRHQPLLYAVFLCCYYCFVLLLSNTKLTKNIRQ
jgi:hypothetical protein